MDLTEIRRRMLMGQKSNELYPIGTDILGTYIGRSSNGFLLLDKDTTFNNNGEIVAGHNATSSVYIPVNAEYQYQKGARRLICHFYDKNYNYLGKDGDYSWIPEVQILNSFPQEVKFIRCVFLNGQNANWNVDITRIA